MAGTAITELLGKPTYRKEGEIYRFENDFISMAYAVTSDPAKVGTIGIVDDTFVEFISEQQRELWDAACQRQS